MPVSFPPYSPVSKHHRHRLVSGPLLGTATIALLLPAVTAVGEAPAPETLELTGVVRDFREHSNQDGGHPDMERRPNAGFGHYAGNIGPELSMDSKPVFVGGGRRVYQQWRDAENRPICYRLYDGSLGDQPGTQGPMDSGGITSAESFNQWFRDVPGVNMSAELTLTLVRQDDGSYVFDDKDDPVYEDLGGFFPIEDQLLGNPGGSPDRNFHFTFELHTQFVYHADDKQSFRFTGDDDVWVYIDGKLVIDLGGVHGATDQWVHLDRLELTDGETYRLDFFFAERHRTQSNFRISTNLALETAEVPAITAAFD